MTDRSHLRRKTLTRGYRQRNAQIIKNWKLEQKCCAKCKLEVTETTTHLFDCDHIDPSTKSFKLSGGGARSVERLFAELAKCQMLCGPCHIIRTRLEKHFLLAQPASNHPRLFDV